MNINVGDMVVYNKYGYNVSIIVKDIYYNPIADTKGITYDGFFIPLYDLIKIYK